MTSNQLAFTDTFLRLVIFKIHHFVRQQLDRIDPSHNLGNNKVKQMVFGQLAKEADQNQQQIRKLITFIYRYHEKVLKNIDHTLGNQQIEFLSRQQTKKYIKNVINQEILQMRPIAVQKHIEDNVEFQQLQIVSNYLNIESKQSYEKLNSINQQPINEHPHQPSEQPINPSPSLQNQDKLIKIQEKVYSNPRLKIQKILEITEVGEVNKTSKQEKKDESFYRLNSYNKINIKIEEEISTLEQTERYGHFIYGDMISKIHDIFLVYEEIYALIVWKQRSNGVTPEDSSIDVNYIRQFEPRVLAQFYEDYLKTHVQ